MLDTRPQHKYMRMEHYDELSVVNFIRDTIYKKCTHWGKHYLKNADHFVALYGLTAKITLILFLLYSC